MPDKSLISCCLKVSVGVGRAYLKVILHLHAFPPPSSTLCLEKSFSAFVQASCYLTFSLLWAPSIAELNTAETWKCMSRKSADVCCQVRSVLPGCRINSKMMKSLFLTPASLCLGWFILFSFICLTKQGKASVNRRQVLKDNCPKSVSPTQLIFGCSFIEAFPPLQVLMAVLPGTMLLLALLSFWVFMKDNFSGQAYKLPQPIKLLPLFHLIKGWTQGNKPSKWLIFE